MLASNHTDDFWSEIENEESYTDLVMAIEFSDRDRVSLFIAVCDVDLVQSETIARYTKQLESAFRSYEVSVNSNQLSVTRSISELVECEPYLQSGSRAVIAVIGATSLASVKLDAEADKSDRDTFFGYLQWTRESFQKFHFPIILWVSKKIYDLMLSETPDFWSWRNGVFFFKANSINYTRKLIPLANERELELSSYESNSLPDVEQLIQRISQRNSEDPLLPNLYDRLGQLYFDRLQTGTYNDYIAEQTLALDYFQKAIDLTKKYQEFPRDNLAISLNHLANLYRFQGKLIEAEHLYEEALQIWRTLYRERPNNNFASRLSASLNNLAGLLFKYQDKWVEAEHLYEEALQIRRTLYRDRPNNKLATSLNNLGVLYESAGKWSKAEPLYEEALQIRRTLFGRSPNNDLATSLNHLAGSLYRQGRRSEAANLYEQALQIRRKLFGEQANNDLATTLNNLGVLYESIGKWSKAEPLYEQALQIRRTLFGKQPNNDLATSLNNLATSYLSMNKYARAEALYLEALEISENILGSNHANTISIQNSLQTLRPELKKLQQPRRDWWRWRF
jgi:tetratricopeptide (TPR) repeat protein